MRALRADNVAHTCVYYRRNENPIHNSVNMQLRFLLLAALPTGVSSGVCSRAPKRGVAVHTAQTCDVLDAHKRSSWWYSWGLGTGFDGSFCDAPDDAAARARESHMDFVPMFWGEGHIDDFLAAPEAWHHELDQASYLLTCRIRVP